jgi:hypothetical protein
MAWLIEKLGLDSQQGKDNSLFSTKSIMMALGPTQPPIK